MEVRCKYKLSAYIFASCLLSITASAATSPVMANALRTHAATQTAQNNAACTAIQPFYWEIGNQTEALASGSVGGRTYTANTLMPIASASKWIFGAYVVQARQGQLNQDDIAALTMSSGYTNFGSTSCVKLLAAIRDAQTVNQCFQTDNPRGGNNADYNADALGKFFYNGGHFQKLALDLGLGADNNTALQRDMQMYLGTDFKFTFGSPQLAGGVNTSASNYAIFLRKILNKQLYIGDFLGAYSVCTNPKTCTNAIYTPVPANLRWDYSLGHWVESDPVSGDGAFSSAGAFGFYPWIDKSKTFYGIIARKDSAGSGSDSSACGRLIRKAWVTGRAQ
ncbi:hypothetical protein GCM10011613_23510 [Cellvibrio zantedeschiae]|uniref:Uncharacterized protein n=1 Tax=Cellvibrio zantedeschiae TaxID=1237077 RepID=A0ABQ3B841_9GAMM|nr:hypothetical protein [Cellvibrio zantedeschiae]GGY78206.1 hypothetical protein GCM10011613_23510 [Cellvibrio zantedeschiae]